MNEKMSQLKLYSIGIVVEAKKRGSPFIKVYPIEELPMANGKLSDNTKIIETKGKNVNSNDKTSKSKSDNIIVAKWLPEQSNRATPPDVQPSEHVFIYKFADTDEFFWSCCKYEPNLRRLETVKYTYGDLPSGINNFDDDSSYWVQYSTHDKHVHLHTAKSNGEPFEYDVYIDAEEGKIVIKDDVGNYIEFDSSTDTLTAHMNREICLMAPVIRHRCNVFIRESYNGSKELNSSIDSEVNFSDE